MTLLRLLRKGNEPNTVGSPERQASVSLDVRDDDFYSGARLPDKP